MKPLTPQQIDLLQKMIDGWMLFYPVVSNYKNPFVATGAAIRAPGGDQRKIIHWTIPEALVVKGFIFKSVKGYPPDRWKVTELGKYFFKLFYGNSKGG